MAAKPRQGARGDRLAQAMRDIAREPIAHPWKTARLNLRLTEGELAEMQETAASLGLSISEYLRRLHAHARERLTLQGG